MKGKSSLKWEAESPIQYRPTCLEYVSKLRGSRTLDPSRHVTA